MKRRPSHPGALIREISIPEARLTVSELAKRCGVARNTLSKIVNERGDVTEDIAIRLSCVLGSSPQFWLAMQSKLNVWKLQQDNRNIYKKIERIHIV